MSLTFISIVPSAIRPVCFSLHMHMLKCFVLKACHRDHCSSYCYVRTWPISWDEIVWEVEMWGRSPRTQIRGAASSGLCCIGESRRSPPLCGFHDGHHFHEVTPLQNHLYIYRGLSCNSLMADSCSDRTPLHEAAYQGRLLHVMCLIAQGFQVNTLTMDTVSPLHEACLGVCYACAKFLLDNGANAQAMSADGAMPLFNCCSSGSVASIHNTHQLASPLHQAAKKGHRECLELLFCGAQIDLELPDVGTPLYAACRAPAAACVKLLLHSGADVGSGCGQDSPLHGAVRAGEANVVELLLDFGAERACRNADGKTPLDLSAPNSAV
ncbi:hypothetical protein AMECASPLE_033631 [Ameca splendens]|uniref:Ankyrin repeat and SOCS box containing 11 n=1 Tax=Ameca splendens TaxID=208324 RepID=A0ABV0XW36_9TELE